MKPSWDTGFRRRVQKVGDTAFSTAGQCSFSAVIKSVGNRSFGWDDLARLEMVQKGLSPPLVYKATYGIIRTILQRKPDFNKKGSEFPTALYT
jgi:hypothetical protein